MTPIEKGYSEACERVNRAVEKSLTKHGAQFDSNLFLRLAIITEEIGECAHAAMNLYFGDNDAQTVHDHEEELFAEIADVAASAKLVLAQLLGELRK